MTFDNSNKTKISSALLREEARLPAIASSYLYSLFPFIISFGQDMVIQTTGKSLTQVGNILVNQGCNNIYVAKNDIHDHQFKPYIFRFCLKSRGPESTNSSTLFDQSLSLNSKSFCPDPTISLSCRQRKTLMCF